jgi:heme-degrading monooxygenase HmoA
MYIALSRLRVAPARVDELISAFRARAGLVEGHDGFIGLEVWRSEREEGELLMVSRWQTRECFSAYMKSADHRASHARIEPGLANSVRLERLEHLSTYEVVAT